jgi:hypothetical membrane protein
MVLKSMTHEAGLFLFVPRAWIGPWRSLLLRLPPRHLIEMSNRGGTGGARPRFDTGRAEEEKDYMSYSSSPSPTPERPYLLKTLAVVGILGCLVLVAGMFAAQSVVPNYHWVSDTISDLAAGEWEIVMDVALYGFATGLFAVSLAAAHAHLGGPGWSIGVLSFAVLAALVIVVGARNEYGDDDNDGVVIHIYLVYGIGALFTLAPLCMARAAGEHYAWAQRVLIGLALVWAILCPIFLLVPTGVDGLLERALGLIACAIVFTLCTVFFMRANGVGARPVDA